MASVLTSRVIRVSNKFDRESLTRALFGLGGRTSAINKKQVLTPFVVGEVQSAIVKRYSDGYRGMLTSGMRTAINDVRTDARSWTSSIKARSPFGTGRGSRNIVIRHPKWEALTPEYRKSKRAYKGQKSSKFRRNRMAQAPEGDHISYLMDQISKVSKSDQVIRSKVAKQTFAKVGRRRSPVTIDFKMDLRLLKKVKDQSFSDYLIDSFVNESVNNSSFSYESTTNKNYIKLKMFEVGGTSRAGRKINPRSIFGETAAAYGGATKSFVSKNVLDRR